MSHYKIVVKVWADDEDEAFGEVTDSLNDSVQPGNNVGWDYHDDPVHITKKILKSEYKLKSFDELEKKLSAERKDSIEYIRKQIKEDLRDILAPSFLNKEDAVLHVGDNEAGEKFIKEVEKILKSKKDKVIPTCFEDILSKVTEAIIGSATDSSSLSLYHLRKLEALEDCIDNTDPYTTLQSTDNPFAELPCDDKEGKFAFYFECDRHC